MENKTRLIRTRTLLHQYIIPRPLEFVVYVLASLLLLVLASYKMILSLLADGTPVQAEGFRDIFSQQLTYIDQILATPVLGRIILFLFWLAIGSVVYVIVWLFQNLAIEVYDDLTLAQLRGRDESQKEGYWGTTLSHALFFSCSVILLLFFVAIAINFFFPVWLQLFQVGLQNISELPSIGKALVGLAGMTLSVHGFVIFGKLFLRFRDYIYNAY